MKRLTLRTIGDYFIAKQVTSASKSGSLIIPDSAKTEEYVIFEVVGIDSKTSANFNFSVGDYVVCAPRGMLTAPLELTVEENGEASTPYDAARLKLVRASNVIAIYALERDEVGIENEVEVTG